MAAPSHRVPLPAGLPGRLLALALTLALLAVAWFAVADPVLAFYTGRQADITERRVLARRMANVAAALPAWQRRAAAAAGSAPPAAILLDGNTDAIAAATLQERVQDMATHAGATLSSLETLPVVPAGDYRRVALRVSVLAPWPVLVGLLQSVERASPRMLIDDLQLRASPSLARPGNAPIESSFTVIAFRRGAVS